MTQTRTDPDEERTERRRVTPQAVGEDRIRIRAYELYEERGGAPGDAESDWYRAEQELTTEGGAEKE